MKTLKKITSVERLKKIIQKEIINTPLRKRQIEITNEELKQYYTLDPKNNINEEYLMKTFHLEVSPAVVMEHKYYTIRGNTSPSLYVFDSFKSWQLHDICIYCMTTDYKMILALLKEHHGFPLIFPHHKDLTILTLNYLFEYKLNADACLAKLEAIAIANRLTANITDNTLPFSYAERKIFDTMVYTTTRPEVDDRLIRNLSLKDLCDFY